VNLKIDFRRCASEKSESLAGYDDLNYLYKVGIQILECIQINSDKMACSRLKRNDIFIMAQINLDDMQFNI
jgi:hypothetical protein